MARSEKKSIRNTSTECNWGMGKCYLLTTVGMHNRRAKRTKIGGGEIWMFIYCVRVLLAIDVSILVC